MNRRSAFFELCLLFWVLVMIAYCLVVLVNRA